MELKKLSGRKAGVLHEWIIPIVGVLLVCTIDKAGAIWSGVTVAPLVLVTVLFILSVRLTPKSLASWAVAYFVFLFVSLSHLPAYDMSKKEDRLRLAIRLGSFAVASAIACTASRYRLKLLRQHDDMLQVLTSLPAPVILSDAAGYIVYLNKKASDLLKIGHDSECALKYVDQVMTHLDEGKAMRFYIEFFEDAEGRVDNLTVRLRDIKHDTKARIICIGHGKDRSLVTLLENE